MTCPWYRQKEEEENGVLTLAIADVLKSKYDLVQIFLHREGDHSTAGLAHRGRDVAGRVLGCN
jgi:hypothetical protein